MYFLLYTISANKKCNFCTNEYHYEQLLHFINYYNNSIVAIGAASPRLIPVLVTLV